MQLIPRYLVNDRIKVVSNDAGFTVEYRSVYSRTLTIYRGIDNTIQFRMLNADQKPITITNELVLVVFDETNIKILEKTCTVTDDGSTVAARGMFQATITENELLNLKQQYLKYNIYQKNNDVNTVTYANRNFQSAGIIYLDGNAYPGPKSSVEITNFYPGDNDFWYAGSDDADKITAQPGLNGNEALHTAAIYTNNYVGSIEVQATLDNQITSQNNWTTMSTLIFNGLETEPVPVNFNGVFSYIRFKLNADPTDKVSKILIRN
jgi:hypothetical protein